MISKTKTGGAAVKREVTVTRSVNAPRETVFRAWTDPKQLAQWWGPHGFTNPVFEMEAVPGGSLKIIMRGPDGAEYSYRGIVCEVEEPARLVFTTALEGEKGNTLAEILNIAAFAEHEGRTEITLNARVIDFAPEAAALLDGVREGWSASLERLDDLLTKVPASLV